MRNLLRFLDRLSSTITRVYAILLTVILVAVVAAVVWVWYGVKHTSLSLASDDEIDCTPTMVDKMKSIGQWEFLSISDEELVDTVRTGFFSDDELVRIYYGKLSLGIDLSQCSEDWIETKGDTVYVTVPEVKLLDQNFIDEAKTKSFFESGKWSNADRQAMYNRAREMMLKRCMTQDNINTAKANAQEQIAKMLTNLTRPTLGPSHKGREVKCIFR